MPLPLPLAPPPPPWTAVGINAAAVAAAAVCTSKVRRRINDFEHMKAVHSGHSGPTAPRPQPLLQQCSTCCRHNIVPNAPAPAPATTPICDTDNSAVISEPLVLQPLSSTLMPPPPPTPTAASHVARDTFHLMQAKSDDVELSDHIQFRITEVSGGQQTATGASTTGEEPPTDEADVVTDGEYRERGYVNQTPMRLYVVNFECPKKRT